MKTLNSFVSDEFYLTVRIESAKANKSMSRFVREILEKYFSDLNETQSQATWLHLVAGGLGGFD